MSYWMCTSSTDPWSCQRQHLLSILYGAVFSVGKLIRAQPQLRLQPRCHCPIKARPRWMSFERNRLLSRDLLYSVYSSHFYLVRWALRHTPLSFFTCHLTPIPSLFHCPVLTFAFKSRARSLIPRKNLICTVCTTFKGDNVSPWTVYNTVHHSLHSPLQRRTEWVEVSQAFFRGISL